MRRKPHLPGPHPALRVGKHDPKDSVPSRGPSTHDSGPEHLVHCTQFLNLTLPGAGAACLLEGLWLLCSLCPFPNPRSGFQQKSEKQEPGVPPPTQPPPPPPPPHFQASRGAVGLQLAARRLVRGTRLRCPTGVVWPVRAGTGSQQFFSREGLSWAPRCHSMETGRPSREPRTDHFQISYRLKAADPGAGKEH